MKNDLESIHAMYLNILRESSCQEDEENQAQGEFGGEDVDQVLSQFGFRWSPRWENWQQDEKGFLFTIKHDRESGNWTLEQYESLDDGYYSSDGWKSLTWTFGSLDELLDALDDSPVDSEYGRIIDDPKPEIDYGGGAPEPDDRDPHDYD
jgi:hypothetical protein